jgi:hypothetical protein
MLTCVSLEQGEFCAECGQLSLLFRDAFHFGFEFSIESSHGLVCAGTVQRQNAHLRHRLKKCEVFGGICEP